ncbi:protein FAM183A [Xyrichtys novacula]|uniref:Protein FAM183A n=1 Tax=Xyrichtys novacula TaxID=13765 RepID=A0AAV1FI35_XYRNO|nr:protein FAM183A [Xyrichtys novacula]
MAEKKKETPNMVHENTIFIETVKKELRHLKLQTEVSFNPYRKVHLLPDKPMARKQPEILVDTTEYIEAYRRIHQEPSKKYPEPLTESQKIGWWASQLTPQKRSDRLYFPRVCTDVTRH